MYLLSEREEGREKERERNINMQQIDESDASRTPSTRDPACNPGMCPDWGLNWPPFGLQAGA